jgi:hypothetical protein
MKTINKNNNEKKKIVALTVTSMQQQKWQRQMTINHANTNNKNNTESRYNVIENKQKESYQKQDQSSNRTETTIEI